MDGQKFHTGYVNQCALSASGAYLATSSDDCTCKIWNTLSMRNDMDSVLSFSSSSQRRVPSHLVSLHAQQRHRIDLNGEETPLSSGFHGTLTHTLRHDGPVEHVAFTADGEHLLTTSADCTVRLWRVYDAQQVYQVNVPSPAKAVQLLPWPAVEGAEGVLGRVFIATADRVVTVDLALRSAPLVVAAAAFPMRALAPRKTKASGANNKSPRKRRSTRRITGGGRARAQATQLHAGEGHEAKAPVASQQDSFRKALAHASLAPQFLQRLLLQTSNGSWAGLQLNLARYGLSEAMLLRLVAQMKDFRPADAVLAFASTDAPVDRLFTALLSGADYHEAMEAFGFRTYTQGEMQAEVATHRAPRMEQSSVLRGPQVQMETARNRQFPAQQRNIMRLVMSGGEDVARVHADGQCEDAVALVAKSEKSVVMHHSAAIPLQTRTSLPSVPLSARGPERNRKKRSVRRRVTKSVLRGLLETGSLNAASSSVGPQAAPRREPAAASFSTSSFVDLSSNLPTVPRVFADSIVSSARGLPQDTLSKTSRSRAFIAQQVPRTFTHPRQPVNLNHLLTSIRPDKPRLSHVGIVSGRRDKVMSKASDLWLRTNFDNPEEMASDDDNDAVAAASKHRQQQQQQQLSGSVESAESGRATPLLVNLWGSGSSKALASTVVASEKEMARELKQEQNSWTSAHNVIPGVDILFSLDDPPESKWRNNKFALANQPPGPTTQKARPFVLNVTDNISHPDAASQLKSVPPEFRTTSTKQFLAPALSL